MICLPHLLPRSLADVHWKSRTWTRCAASVFGLWLIAADVSGQTPIHYVSPDGSNTAPFTSWATAATNIQAAVAAASTADTVLVADGTYFLSSTIIIPTSISLQSVNGPESTVINGNYPYATNLCVYVSNCDAQVIGFRIINGRGGTSGGIRLDHGGVVKQCIIANNWGYYGGGVRIDAVGTVINCILFRNSTSHSGGGIYCYYGGTVENCTVVSNTASGYGGGIAEEMSGTYLFRNNICLGNTAGSGGNNTWVSTNLYSCTVPKDPATGNITNDPCFADAAGGDFHLKSIGGRWVPSSQLWTYDSVVSPCIDAGDSACSYSNEPSPSGGRINMGAYGNTPEASKSTWLWTTTTNYWLTVQTNGSGTLAGATNGWYPHGTNFLLTAAPSPHYHLVNWTGTGLFGSDSSLTLSVTMNQARSITANFAIDQFKLVVLSAQSNCVPMPGTNMLNYGAQPCSVTTPKMLSGTTQYFCTGWTGTGNVTNGMGTNTSFTLDTDSSITWLWPITNYWLTVETNGNGTVGGATNGWCLNGSNFLLTAVPPLHSRLVNWTGTGLSGSDTGLTLSVTMNQARSITANFAIDQFKLVVVSSQGGCVPPLGTNTLNYGALSCSVTNSPKVLSGSTQYVCMGWTGTGGVTNGMGTNTSFTLDTDSSMTWLLSLIHISEPTRPY